MRIVSVENLLNAPGVTLEEGWSVTSLVAMDANGSTFAGPGRYLGGGATAVVEFFEAL